MYVVNYAMNMGQRRNFGNLARCRPFPVRRSAGKKYCIRLAETPMKSDSAPRRWLRAITPKAFVLPPKSHPYHLSSLFLKFET